MFLKNKGVFFKILLPIVVLFPIGMGIVYFLVSTSSKNNIIQSQVRNSQSSISQFKTIRGYYTKNIISKVKQSSDMKPHYNHKGKKGVVPLPATFIHDLSDEFKKKKINSTLNLYSEFPFPNRKSRKLDSFQVEAIKFLKSNPNETFVKSYKNDQGRNVVRVAIADFMSAQGCVNCHNSHPETPKNDWKLGDVRGVLEISSDTSSELASVNDMNRNLLVTLGITFLVLILVVALIVNRSVVNPIKELTQRISGNADKSMEQMNSLNSQSRELADISSVQASSVHETASSLEEIKVTSERSVENAQSATNLSTNSRNNANLGVDSIKEMVKSIDEISVSNDNILSNVVDSNKQIEDVIRIIEEISEKTKVINDIVFQTKLLSFNASVEAARAGEQGKGFSVVAEEVGNLAQMSGTASEEISQLLEGSMDKVKSIIDKTQSSVDGMVQEGKIKVEHGSKVAGECSDILYKIEDSTKLIAEAMKNIENSSKEQSIGFTDISTAIHQISTSVESSANISREVSVNTSDVEKNIEELREIAKSLEDEIFGIGHS